MLWRVSFAFVISLCGTLFSMPSFIRFLKKISFNQTVSEYSLDEYKNKTKTPTMGGVLFVVVTIVTTLLVQHSYLSKDLLIVLLAFVGYASIGMVDDYLIIIKKDNKGLIPLHKFALQGILAIIVFYVYQDYASLSVTIPLIQKSVSLGILYVVLIFFMFVGASNAVNITDGMDGLAAGCTAIALVPFLAFALLDYNVNIAVFIAALFGSLLGYLKYNVYPAKVFMGDAGSLALGGALAAISMVLKLEVAFVFIAGVFVWETVCVILQIGSVKLRKKRIFSYTPIHYAFVLKGLREKVVVQSFWKLAAACAVIGFILALF
ncbi:MAG: phospho-N-acetylmuramoyl-pentapeptide-transferase [Anaerorhabdus sp.]